MHELRDFKDINKSRIYTRSILLKKRSKEDEELEKYQYEHMHPLEDFVRPYDLESRRSTGYEYGHVRSLLKLDTFGPTNSASILKRRAEGELPASPNLDRHNLISPEHELKPSTLVPISSANSSRASSADDSSNYRGAFPSLQSLRRNAERKARASTSPHQDERQSIKAVKGNNDVSDYVMQKNADLLVIQHDQRSETSGRMSMYSQITSFAGPALTASRSVYSSSRPETSSSRVGSRGSARFPDSSFHGVAITEKERILKDPFLRRREWYKSYTRRLEVRTFDKFESSWHQHFS